MESRVQERDPKGEKYFRVANIVIFMMKLDDLMKGSTVDSEKDQGLSPGNSRIKRSGKRKGTSKWAPKEAAGLAGGNLS